MLSKIFLTTLVGFVSAAAALNATESSLETRQGGCARGAHIIALGGQKTTQGDLGYLATLAYGIRDSIKGSTLSQIGYPEGADGPTAIAYATPRLRNHIKEYSAGCPNTPIIIAGYSVGATISMNVFCGAYDSGANALGERYGKAIAANVIYGDLTFIPRPHYTFGTCSIPSKRPRQKPRKCFPFGLKTRSYCDAGDVECCSGTDGNVHFTYPDKYDQNAIGFAVGKYKTWRKKHPRRG